MKLAFSTAGEGMDSLLDTRFGRCARFLILDLESGAVSLLENSQNLNAAQGAGIQSAQNVITVGVDALVTGHCGPKAFKVLRAAGVPIYLGEEISIQVLAEQFQQGSLALLQEADVEGHW